MNSLEKPKSLISSSREISA